MVIICRLSKKKIGFFSVENEQQHIDDKNDTHMLREN